MRISALTVENFRALRKLELSNLRQAVVLAGPNGCGKSCVFDAIRLLKSGYGQYHENEYQSWFQEFQIDLKDLNVDLSRIKQEPQKQLRIAAQIELTQDELAFLKENGRHLIQQIKLNGVKRRRMPIGGVNRPIPPNEQREYRKQVADETEEALEQLGNQLKEQQFEAELIIEVNGDVEVVESPVMELVFSHYAPDCLGVVEYLGPSRTYAREKLGTVNLSVDSSGVRNRQSALYNTQNKYTNIKTEMASAYVRELVSRDAGVTNPEATNLTETLKELFEEFFPTKRFLGPKPTADGRLQFHVELETGAVHDIDDLSSGEKEVLLGYLRLRNAAPRNSVLLIDEPELHLNPRLLHGLPRFYEKHLGSELGNQLWLATHSDALLRDAVDESTFNVFHLQPVSSLDASQNQAQQLVATGEVERAVIDLIGDLATYSPHARIVLLEGGGESDLDCQFVRKLFPDFALRVNLISAGRKAGVRNLHAILDDAIDEGRWRARLFSIVDRDFVTEEEEETPNRFRWEVYHIENYLLHPEFIREAIATLELGDAVPEAASIERALHDCAEESMPDLIRMKMQSNVHERFVACLRNRINPSDANVANELRRTVERSLAQIQSAAVQNLSLAVLEKEVDAIRAELQAALITGEWKNTFRGRDILKRFVDRMRLGKKGINYESFRNLIINNMKHAGYKPPGMARILDHILQT